MSYDETLASVASSADYKEMHAGFILLILNLFFQYYHHNHRHYRQLCLFYHSFLTAELQLQMIVK